MKFEEGVYMKSHIRHHGYTSGSNFALIYEQPVKYYTINCPSCLAENPWKNDGFICVGCSTVWKEIGMTIEGYGEVIHALVYPEGVDYLVVEEEKHG